jgi:putative ABC transport system ATP-binding protein
VADTGGDGRGEQAPQVRVEGVSRTFGRGRNQVHAVREASFTAWPGEMVAIRGRSGAGKTTLLHLIGGLDRASDGTVWVAGHEVTDAAEDELRRLRRDTIGFVFQSFGLLPILSAAENVGIPMRLAGTDPEERERRVTMLLELVGLGEHALHRPNELSGGQQQRVAIARALANDPSVLLADEPTGQLDTETGRMVVEMLHAVVRARQVTALVATHDPSVLDLADRVLTLRDGCLEEAPSGSAAAGRGR